MVNMPDPRTGHLTLAFVGRTTRTAKPSFTSLHDANLALGIPRGRYFAAAIQDMGRAWFSMTTAGEPERAAKVMKTGKEVFGVSIFELECDQEIIEGKLAREDAEGSNG